MTPIEKANELIEKFMLYSCKKTEISKETMQYEYSYKIKRYLAIQCAIIAVDEIIDELKREPYANYERIVFWQSVKNELETLKN